MLASSVCRVEDPHSSMLSSRRALLFVNLGSPAAPTSAAVKEFLEEFLSDRRVVDLNPLFWKILRRTLVLPRRCGPVAQAYSSIWTANGSPLTDFTRRVCAQVRERAAPGLRVEFAMRYGTPSLRSVVSQLVQDEVSHIRLVPLFPQFSEATSGSILEEMGEIVASLPRPPTWDALRTYHADPGYIEALAASVRDALERGQVDHFVWSFHGLPVRYVERGDPYARESKLTAELLSKALGLREDQWSLVWQSRFGKGKWLEPAADTFVTELAKTKRRVLIACPGFAADCLETLEEIGQRLDDSFRRNGGEELRLVPCLNAHPRWIDALSKLSVEPLRR